MTFTRVVLASGFAWLTGDSAVKRWLVVLLVLLALLILIAPGIVGRLAEDNIAQNIEWAEQDSPGVIIETESFERGWFTSEGRYRVVFDGERFTDAADQYQAATGNPELPSLIIDTSLAHGPLPGGSPGIATTVSTFQVDPGNGETIEIPGQLTTRVSLGGTTDGDLVIEAGTFDHEDARFEWQGVQMHFTSNPGSGAIAVDGQVQPLAVSADGERFSIGTTTIKADQTRSDFGFNVGTVDMSVGEIRMEDPASLVTIDSISLTADSSIAADRVNAASTFAIRRIAVPAVGNVDFEMDIAFSDIDAESAAVIGKALQDAQGSADPEAALEAIYPEIEDEVETMFRKGFSMKMDKLDVTLPQGIVASSIDLDVPPMDESAAFDWSTVLLNMTANVDIHIPGPIYDMAAMMNAQAGSLVAMGILKQDGEDYVMEAEYAQGLFNVNGAPMPIPMPGM